MRFAVLAAADSWYFADLRRAAVDRHEIAAIPFRALGSSVSCSRAERGSEVSIDACGVDIGSFDALLVRTMPSGSLEQVVFRMDALARLEAAGVPVVNPARAIECAVDKYLTIARLAVAGLPVPRTITCQTVAQALQAFDDLGGDVVLKPLFGSEGRGITRLKDRALAERAFRLLVDLGSVLYLQEFIPHNGADIRVLIVGNKVLAMRRVNPFDWRTNISRGAVAEAVEPRDEWVELARSAADAVGASVAGVDLLPGRDGQMYVIEVNAVPGWKALAGAHRRDVAAMVLEHLQEQV
ncbi:MAG: RimK family alpha-L-glutamate ligase [Pirellulales bacterium]